LPEKAERYYENNYIPAFKVQLNVVVIGKEIDERGYSVSCKLF
jgi:hypothetical protein